MKWVLRFFLGVFALTLFGALLGAVSFPVVGSLLGIKMTAWEMSQQGIFDLGKWFFIWAPAVSLVFCVMLAQREKAVKSDV